MSIPDYQTLMRPLLQFASDGEEHSSRSAVEHLAQECGLSEDDRRQLLPSGQQPLFDNRVGWARTYLKQAGLLESTKRGFFRITSRGREVLAENPERIDGAYLERFPEFLDFRQRSRKSGGVTAEVTTKDGADESESVTPRELLEEAHQRLRDELAQDLLARVMESSPSFFEALVVDLLVKMGYGGSRKEAGRAVGQSGDDGIDGIINEDRLGLEAIYIQAKRWKGVVGRPEIQKFVGALHGNRARKGAFITTSSFTSEAREYVSRIDTKVVLLDGDQLAQLMIDFDLGVSTSAVFQVKKVDSDYFAGE